MTTVFVLGFEKTLIFDQTTKSKLKGPGNRSSLSNLILKLSSLSFFSVALVHDCITSERTRKSHIFK